MTDAKIEYLKFVIVLASILLFVGMIWCDNRHPPPSSNETATQPCEGLMPAWKCQSNQSKQGSNLEEWLSQRLTDLTTEVDPVAKLTQLHNYSGQNQENTAPLGDTVFMRYPSSFSQKELAGETAKLFKVVTLSNDIQFKINSLESIAKEQTGLLRYRALLELAQLHLRNKEYSVAQKFLRQALEVPLTENKWKVDSYFLQAYLYLEENQVEQAITGLNKVLAEDKNYVYAYWLYIRALHAQLSKKDVLFSEQICGQHLKGLLESIEYTRLLVKDKNVFLRQAEIMKELVGNIQIKSFAVGYSYLLAGNYVGTKKYLQLLETATHWGNSRCINVLLEKSQELLAQLKQRDL